VRKTIILVLVLFAAAYPFWAATSGMAGSTAGMSAAPGASQFSIRFFDQKIYFLGDPIRVEATITNTGTETLRFEVADNRYFNLDFDVHTTTNVGLDHARDFTIARSLDQPTFYRSVSLEAGEKYAVVVDLTSYAMFTSPGQYVVQASFYPELFRSADSTSMKSNRIALNVKPALITEEERSLVQAETGALLALEALPPDEVVSWTIEARQKSQWEKFFLYLDLESLMRNNPDQDRKFLNSTEEKRREMVDQFRQQLRQATIAQEINVIPSSFQVLNTSYNSSEATVLVLEKFKNTDYTEQKKFTYHLKKSDRYWMIYSYEIKNLETE